MVNHFQKKKRVVVVIAVEVVVGFLTVTAFWESRAQVKFNTLKSFHQ